MARFVVRTSCEYSISIEAKNASEAMDKANDVDMVAWDSAEWSEFEVDEETP